MSLFFSFFHQCGITFFKAGRKGRHWHAQWRKKLYVWAEFCCLRELVEFQGWSECARLCRAACKGGGAYHLSRAPSSRDQRRPKWPRISQNGSKFMTLINHKFRPFPPKTQKFRPMDRKACKGQKFTSIRVQRYILFNPIPVFLLTGRMQICSFVRKTWWVLSPAAMPGSSCTAETSTVCRMSYVSWPPTHLSLEA